MVRVDALGERLGSLRLCEAEALAAMRQSLTQHGQLQAAVVFTVEGGLEIVDGFKRLRAARALGWSELCAHVLAVDLVGAKVAIDALHHHGGLTELEEGWLVRSLYRDDQLDQPSIGRLLGRHKSWVCRRLMLAEGLDAHCDRPGAVATWQPARDGDRGHPHRADLPPDRGARLRPARLR
jgi:ParB-like chromosome segregation protein Spo0J